VGQRNFPSAHQVIFSKKFYVTGISINSDGTTSSSSKLGNIEFQTQCFILFLFFLLEEKD